MRLYRFARFPAVLLVVVVLLASLVSAPRPASASWVAMLQQVGEQIRQAIDIAERHTRLVEDHLDHVAGLQNAYNDVNGAYRNVRHTLAVLGIGQRAPRLGDLYRAGFVDDACLRYDSPGLVLNCELRDFTGGEFHIFEWHLRNLPNPLSGRQDYSTYEAAIRGGWDGTFPTVLAGAVADVVGDSVLGVGAGPRGAARFSRAHVRSRAAYHAGRRRARRLAATMDTGRRAASQMLDQSGRTGSPLSDFTDCSSVATTGMTVIVAALRADCTSSTPLNSDPRGSGDGSANLSEMESRTISVQTQITDTMLRAAELEFELIEYEKRLAAQLELADASREFERRVLQRVNAAGGGVPGCVSFVYGAECAEGLVRIAPVADQRARVNFMNNTF